MKRTTRGSSNNRQRKSQENYNFINGGNFNPKQGNKSGRSGTRKPSSRQDKSWDGENNDRSQRNSHGLKNENRLAEFLTYGESKSNAASKTGNSFHSKENGLRNQDRIGRTSTGSKGLRSERGSRLGDRSGSSRLGDRSGNLSGNLSGSRSGGRSASRSTSRSGGSLGGNLGGNLGGFDGNRKAFDESKSKPKFIQDFDLETLLEIIHERISEARTTPKSEKSPSYTINLYREGIGRIAQKVGEEATEVVIAAMQHHENNSHENYGKLIGETADLFYHLSMLLASKDIELNEVLLELEKRHSQKQKR